MEIETLLSSDESDTEIKSMQKKLIEYGLNEENLSKEEMSDLLQAFNNSKCSIQDDKVLNQKEEDSNCKASGEIKPMKRKYLNVRDRRMPWSILPTNITLAEKAQTLAVYIKLMSINSYRQARMSSIFAAWPSPIQIAEETMTRSQPLRSTRSGRNVPVYADFEDDSSDFDLIVTKTKKRKISSSENDGIYSTKTVSLKRKPSKEDNLRPAKDAKINNDNKLETSTSTVKGKKDQFLKIED